MNIEELKQKISALPSGGVTVKKIKNKETGNIYEYFVYQWRENGKQKSRYLKEDEYQMMSTLLDEKKRLESQLAEAENQMETSPLYDGFFTNVQIGNSLKRLTASVSGLKKREIITDLEGYVFGPDNGRVFILYGLRRTGKTTMIKQVLSMMTEEQLAIAAFIQINSSNDLGQLNQDLRKLADDGFKYVFLEEVTLMDDFIEGAALLSDIFASSGMKVVLSGTDSLGFWISKSNELYDRCQLLHTTFIPYREFENVLGIKGIDTYFQYGGTMSMSGNYYNIFANVAGTDEYIDSAIALNIQHSLKCYQDGGHFRHLLSLYEKDELTSAINRVVEDLNHRFTLNVLTREFKSNDLALAARNGVEMNAVQEKEITDYLFALDVIKEIPIADIDNYRDEEKRVAFTQAGLRYSLAKSLVESWMRGSAFVKLSFEERKHTLERYLRKITSQMLEDVVLLETKMAHPEKEVFKLLFADGEYDMVVFDSKNGGCSIYEVADSDMMDNKQCCHLMDKEKVGKTTFRYGEIQDRVVLYRGESQMVNGIHYLNVEEYLKSL